MVEFRQVTAGEVQPLRTSVLRPEWGAGRVLEFEADDRETTYHFALMDEGDDGAVVAVLSWLEAEAPASIREAAESEGGEEGEGGVAYQLRGMAVAEDRRGSGLGRRLLESSLSRLAVSRPGCSLCWCDARESAVGFYEAQGFEVAGESFEKEGIGTHWRMWRRPPVVLADE